MLYMANILSNENRGNCKLYRGDFSAVSGFCVLFLSKWAVFNECTLSRASLGVSWGKEAELLARTSLKFEKLLYIWFILRRL